MTDWRDATRELAAPLARALVRAIALAGAAGLGLALINLVLIVRGADDASLGRTALRLLGLGLLLPALAAWLTWQAGLLAAARTVARTAAAALARVLVGAAARHLAVDDQVATPVAPSPAPAAAERPGPDAWARALPWPIRRVLRLGPVRRALAPLGSLLDAARGQGTTSARLTAVETELAQRLPALVPAPRWWPLALLIAGNAAAWLVLA